MLKKSKVVLVVVPVVIAILGVAFVFTMSGPNPAQFEYLKDPQVGILPDLKVLQGEHEEEYIKGPGMLSKGNPQKYLTIIRYRVKQAK